jgi:hypothetical protein
MRLHRTSERADARPATTSVPTLWLLWLVASVLQMFDLASGLNMIALDGLRTELNPLIRMP